MGKKKTFKDNPALQFISSTPEGNSTAAHTQTDNTPRENLEALRERFSGADFPIPEGIPQAPEGYKVNSIFLEKKSRRLQLILQPSLYEKVKEAAAQEDISVNEYVHRVLEKATEGKR